MTETFYINPCVRIETFITGVRTGTKPVKDTEREKTKDSTEIGNRVQFLLVLSLMSSD